MHLKLKSYMTSHRGWFSPVFANPLKHPDTDNFGSSSSLYSSSVGWQ